MQAIFDFFEKFITDFNWKRVSLLIFLFISLFITYILYEQTYLSQLSKIEKVTLILKDLENIKVTKENENILDSIYIKIEHILNSDRTFFDFFKKIDLSENIINAIFNSSIWIFLLVIFFISYMKTKKDLDAVFGTLILIFLNGTIGYFLPNENFLFYSILSNFVLIIIIIIFSRFSKD
ncbi:hypothetical protein [Aliarcobacter butzleri]|uniref:hypothetical protein n=1 Tax=Aliarcobacter butzleri TaxID=28197 RepID=UPI00344CBB79